MWAKKHPVSSGGPPSAFLAGAVHLLRERGLSDEFYPLINLSRSIEDDDRRLRFKVLVYKSLGLALLLLIPLLAASISVVLENETLALLLPDAALMSFVLTGLTIINSILEPRRRFALLCRIRIGISQLKNRVLSEIAVQERVSTQWLSECVEGAEKVYTVYQEQQIEAFLPRGDHEA